VAIVVVSAGERLPRALVVGGTTASALALALPWAASGRRWRSGFELLGVARDLELADSFVARTLIAAVLLVPMLAAALWVLQTVRAYRWTVAIAVLAAVLVVSFAVVVVRSPLMSGVGVPIAVISSGCALFGAARLLRVGKDS
jgi:hypothetical protein